MFTEVIKSLSLKFLMVFTFFFFLLSVTRGVKDWCSTASNDVKQVVDSIVSSLTSQTPKSRYVIGCDAWQLKLSAHLPESWQDLLLKDFPLKPMAIRQ